MNFGGFGEFGEKYLNTRFEREDLRWHEELKYFCSTPCPGRPTLLFGAWNLSCVGLHSYKTVYIIGATTEEKLEGTSAGFFPPPLPRLPLLLHPCFIHSLPTPLFLSP